MSSINYLPQGVVERPDFEHAAGVTPALWREFSVLLSLGYEQDVRAAIGALQAGLGEDAAMRLAYAAL